MIDLAKINREIDMASTHHSSNGRRKPKHIEKLTIPILRKRRNLFKNENIQKRRQMKTSTLFRQAIMEDSEITNKDKKIASVYYCGAYRRYYLNNHKTHKRLNFACFCNERLCPQCGRHKSFKARVKLSTLIKYMDSHYQYKNGNPKYIPIFATFTIPNIKDDPKTFKATFQKLHHAFSSMMRYKKFCGFMKKSKRRLKGIIQGGMSKVEITYNKNKDTFHLHLHALLLVHRSYFTSKYYVKHTDWQHAWESAVGWNPMDHYNNKRGKQGLHLQVRIERPYYKDKDGHHHKITNLDKNKIKGAEREAITEVTGYETKSDDFTKILDKDNNKSNKFIEKHLEQAQRAFNTAYFGTKHQNTYTYFGLLGKLSKMYNNNELDTFKPKDNNIYKYGLNAKYKENEKKFNTKDRKLTKDEMKEAQAKGLRTPLDKHNKDKGNNTKDIPTDTKIYKPYKISKANKPAKAGLRSSE